MPNRCSNLLEINKTTNELVDEWWLIELKPEERWVTTYSFNLHKLFPEKYKKPYKEYKYYFRNKTTWKIDSTIHNTFEEEWDYDWCIENIWTKWYFEMETIKVNDEDFISSFETAWSPPTAIIQRFSELSKIEWRLEYEESGMWFQWVIDFIDWWYEDYEEDYQARCDTCEKKKDDVTYYDNIWIELCDECKNDYWSTCCQAVIKNWLCTDCHEHDEWPLLDE